MNRDYAKRALDFLADMIRFKSYSGTPAEGELARFVVERMQRLGLEAFTQEVKPRRMNAIGIWHGTGGGRVQDAARRHPATRRHAAVPAGEPREQRGGQVRVRRPHELQVLIRGWTERILGVSAFGITTRAATRPASRRLLRRPRSE